MNEPLASVLIELATPAQRRLFDTDPLSYVNGTDLPETDRLALLSRNRAVIKYQARFGDLTKERLRLMDFASPDMEHDHVEIGPEHDEGHDEVAGLDDTTLANSFGPFLRAIDPDNEDASTPKDVPVRPNSLVVVGTGISVSHLTDEAIKHISGADFLLYCVADAATELRLRRLNPEYDDLYRFYGNGKLRRETYDEMAHRILSVVREGKNVCAAFYGHPGLFVKPAHMSIQKARDEGYSTQMVPAPSCIDCMIADLGLDPSREGCHVFEATNFLVRRRRPDVESGLALLQIGCVGDFSFNATGFDGRHFPLLVEHLRTFYQPNHPVILYEASQFSICQPRVDLISMRHLSSAHVNGITTMYIPPARKARIDSTLSQHFRENAPSYS